MTSNSSESKSVIGGLGWSAFERLAVQGIQLVVFILMARTLSPVDYGLVAMLSFFIILSQLIAEGGLSQAIIRKMDRSQADCSTVFYVNILAGLALYGILALSAPAIAAFYGEQRLTALLRVLGLAVVIQSTLVVHRAVLTASLDFKTQAKSTLVGAIASGAVGLWMAYSGCGPWALVGLQITNQAVTGTTLWLVSSWRPSLRFCRRSFRSLFGFGSKLLMSNVLVSLYNSLYSLTIGKLFSAYTLGCYGNAAQISAFSSENLTRIVQRAAFPMFCHFQSDNDRLRQLVRQYLRLAMLCLAPLLLGLAALAKPLTLALIGQQWLYTAMLLKILCVAGLFFPLNSINFMILEILGNGRLYLRLQTVNTLIGAAMLAATLPFGVSAVCVGLCVAGFANFVINAHFAGRKISLGFFRQAVAILPLLLCAAAMAAVILLFRTILGGSVWLQIGWGIPAGVVVYSALTFLFQTELCRSLLNILRGHSRLSVNTSN